MSDREMIKKCVTHDASLTIDSIPHMTIGVVSSLGQSPRRGSQEDRFTVQMNLPKHPDTVCVAVYDGHGGSADVSEKLSRVLHLELDALGGDLDKDDCIQRLFVNLDQKLFRDCEAGSTAVIAFIRPLRSSPLAGWDAIICHVGDSRALVIRDGQCIKATVDHDPLQPAELKRITDAGGQVDFLGYVNESINLSRAFGDYKKGLKPLTSTPEVKTTSLVQSEQPEPWILTAIPDVQRIRMDRGDMLLLVSDGVVDDVVMTNAQAATIVSQSLAVRPQGASCHVTVPHVRLADGVRFSRFANGRPSCSHLVSGTTPTDPELSMTTYIVDTSNGTAYEMITFQPNTLVMGPQFACSQLLAFAASNPSSTDNMTACLVCMR